MNKEKYKIKYLPVAKKDLEKIIDYIQIDSPNAALNLLENIDKSILQLKDFPYKGSYPKDDFLKSKNYRMLIIKSYLVFYVVYENKKEVEIRKILHGKRKYKFLL